MAQTITLRAYLDELEDLLAAGASTKVITHCRHILRHFPQNIYAYRLLARALYDRGQRDGTDTHFDEAFEMFQRVLSVFPDDAIAHKHVALLFLRREQVDRAMWHFERAYEQSPSDRDLQHHIHQLHTKQTGAHPPAKIHLTRGALARQYISARLFDQALIELRAAIDESPERIDLQVLLAETLWETQHPIEAGELAVQILKKLPYCLPANQVLARLWLANERPSDAQIFLDRIESLDPYAARRVLSVDANTPDTIVLERLDYDVQSQAALSSETPTWLSDLDAMGDEKLARVGPFADLDASWFSDAAADDSLSDVPSTPDDAASEDTFADWLSEMSRGADTSDHPERDAIFTAQEGASGVDDLAAFPDDLARLAQMPDQIESLLSPDQPLSPATDGDFSVSDAFDEWLADVGQEVGMAADDAPDLPSDWFIGDADETDAIIDDIPISAGEIFRADDGAVDSDVLADIGTEMPDWLSGALGTDGAQPREAHVEDAAWLTDEAEPGAEQPRDEDVNVLPKGWLGSTDDIPDDLLDADESALADAFADLLADEPETQSLLTDETSGNSESLAPDWLDDARRSAVPAQSDSSLIGRDQDRDESVLWSADKDDLTTTESLEQDVPAMSAVFGASVPEGNTPSDDDQLWDDLLNESAVTAEHRAGMAGLDVMGADYIENGLVAAELPGDSDMHEPDDSLMQPDMDSLLSATDDELLSALAVAASEGERPAADVGDSDAGAVLAEMPDWLADAAPLTDDDLVDSAEDVDALFDGQMMEEVLEQTADTATPEDDAMQPDAESGDAGNDGLGWLRAADADEDWLATLSAADTADVLGLVDTSMEGLSDAATGDAWDELPDATVPADEPDFGADDDDLLVGTGAPGADSGSADNRQEMELPPEDTYVGADIHEQDDQVFEDSSRALEANFVDSDSVEDADDDEDAIVVESDGLAWPRGQEIETAESIGDVDETEVAAVQPYDPFEEGSPENVPHYESAQNTGILQPDELPAWMTAFTGEEMATELDDDAEFDDVEPDTEEEPEAEYAVQGTSEPVASADNELDDRDDTPDRVDEDIDSESPEDLVADVIAADPADGIPAWLLAITESEADKLDSSLFEEALPDSDESEAASDLVTDAEADWLYDINDAAQETSGDGVRDVTESALDLDAVLFGGDDVDEQRADEDEVSAYVAEQRAAWDLDSDVSNEVRGELNAELDAAAEAVLFGGDDGEELAFEPETERSFELTFDNAEQSSLSRDVFAEQELLELDRDVLVDADTEPQHDEPFAEPADMPHTTIHDQQIDETALTDTFEEDDFHLDDIVPVWLRRPKESDLLEDAFDAVQDDLPEPEPPEWLRDVAEDDDQTGGSGT